MRIVIVLTAYNREQLLQKTLESFSQYDPYEFTVIIERDEDRPGKTWSNSCIAFNRGFARALELNPDIVIFQNAECYHAGDLLKYAKEHLTEQNYIAFPCYSLAKDDPLPPVINNRCAAFDGDSAWYNHPVYRPVGYHFCAAITADNLRKLNGFDERFMFGIGYDDNYLLHQIEMLGLQIDIPEAPHVYHQWHYANKKNTPELIQRNADLFAELSQGTEYRAKHLITSDL